MAHTTCTNLPLAGPLLLQTTTAVPCNCGAVQPCLPIQHQVVISWLLSQQPKNLLPLLTPALHALPPQRFAVAALLPQQIIISWFLSPIAAALVCLIIFLLIRTLVLRRPNSTKVAFWVLPVLIIVTIWVNLFFILVR